MGSLACMGCAPAIVSGISKPAVRPLGMSVRRIGLVVGHTCKEKVKPSRCRRMLRALSFFQDLSESRGTLDLQLSWACWCFHCIVGIESEFVQPSVTLVTATKSCVSFTKACVV